MKQIFLYSHGFATHADDNGLFSEIKTFFPNVEHIMFEYDKWNGDEAVATTFSERAKTLQEKYNQVRSENPDADISLICHSQGCNVAALAKLDGVKKTVMLAPPIVYDSPEEEYARQKNKNGAVLDDGTIIRNRAAGYKTIISSDFFNDFSLLEDFQSLLNELSKKTELFVVDALNDTVVKKDYSKLDQDIIIKHVDANHNLKNTYGKREELAKVLHEIFPNV